MDGLDALLVLVAQLEQALAHLGQGFGSSAHGVLPAGHAGLARLVRIAAG
jgi:hypothetical protein